MADTMSYYYWVDIYSPTLGGWTIDSFLSHREYPNDSLLTPGVTANTPDSGKYQRIRGPVIRTPGESDVDFDAAIAVYRDNIPPTPFDGSSSR